MAWFDELFLPPGVTVPIPQFRPPGAFKYGLRDPATGGLHQSVFGTPFIPTPFDESPNVLRPGMAPGQADVAPKPPLPTRAAPMMGRNPAPATSLPEPSIYQENAPPDLMPGAYYGMRVDNPAFKQPSAPEPPKQPSWYDRNKELITMASRDLGAVGRGMLQAPPGYNAFGQGFAKVIDDRETRIDTDLKRQLLKAQVGKVEGESTARQALRDFAIEKKLPTGVALSLMLNPDKAAEILEKYDPAMRDAFLKFTEEKSGATAKGSFPYDLAKAAAQATKVSVSMPAEFQAKLDSLAKYRAAAADPKLSPAQRADAQKMADGIERSITQKDTPDAKYMEQIAGMERGVQGAERLRELVKKYGVSSLDPAGRAAIAQEYSWLITAMKQTEGFGAALTGNEQAILEAGLRNPNSFVNNALIGSKTHLALIDKYIEFTRQRAQSYDRLRRTGTLPPGLSEPPPPPSGFNRMGR